MTTGMEFNVQLKLYSRSVKLEANSLILPEKINVVQLFENKQTLNPHLNSLMLPWRGDVCEREQPCTPSP